MKRYFITGTDTDCGKTYATCRLLQYFNQKNSVAFGIKPVASGCVFQENVLVSEDALLLQAQNPFPIESINPWRFKPPISPHLAARAVNQPLSIQKIAEFCTEFHIQNGQYLLIEGAGGLLAPLTDTESWVDVLQAVPEISVILVVGMKIGCINHALLTQCALNQNKISCAGWIANSIDKNMLAFEENIETLTQLLHIPLLGVIPFGGSLQNRQLETLF
jgi:dethiobiotin synthetase